MRECQHCHRKVQWIIHLFDTGEQDFDPAEKGLGEFGQDWCLACVRGVKWDPDERNALDFSGLLSGDIPKPLPK